MEFREREAKIISIQVLVANKKSIEGGYKAPCSFKSLNEEVEAHLIRGVLVVHLK